MKLSSALPPVWCPLFVICFEPVCDKRGLVRWKTQPIPIQTSPNSKTTQKLVREVVHIRFFLCAISIFKVKLHLRTLNCLVKVSGRSWSWIKETKREKKFSARPEDSGGKSSLVPNPSLKLKTQHIPTQTSPNSETTQDTVTEMIPKTSDSLT